MAESASVLCEGCEFKSLTNNALVWCNDCEEGLCNECVKGHEATKSLRSHHIIPIQDYLSIKHDSVETVCSQHDKKLEKFCLSHDALLCIKCVQEEHCRCDDLLEIDEAAKGVKSSTALAKLEECSNGIIKNIDKVCKTQNKETEQLKEEKDQIKQKINDERAILNSHLDHLQSKLLDELNLRSSNSIAETKAFRSKLHDIKHGICKLQDQTDRLKKHAPEKEIFIGLKTAERNMLRQKNELKQEIDNFENHTLEFEFSLNFKSILTDVNEIGHVKVIHKANTALYEEPLFQAQNNFTASPYAIQGIELKCKREMYIPGEKKPASLRDGVILENGQFVFADYSNHRLIYIDETGCLIEIKLMFRPEYMTFLENNTVLIASGSQRRLLGINSGKKILFNTKKSHVAMSGYYRGLAFSDGKFYRLEKAGASIFITDIEGHRVDSFSAVENAWKLAVQGSCIYYTVHKNDAVYCSDTSGKTIWTFRHELIKTTQYSASISLDHQDNVFILGSGLLVLTADGRHVKVLLSKSELQHLTTCSPSGLFYDKNTCQLLLTFMDSAVAILFDVTY